MTQEQSTRRRPAWCAVPVVLRFVLVGGAVGAATGALWGCVRGVGYLPTLPAAVVEGATLLGVPSAVLGLAVGCVVALVGRIARAVRR